MRQSSILKTVLIVIFCLCIGFIGGMVIYHFFKGALDNPVIAQGTQVEIAQDADIAQVARSYQDCVVSIRTVSKGSSSNYALGSGVCVHAGGYIVTNYHVIEEAVGNSSYNVYIYLNGDTKKSYTAEILWANNDLDLAIVKSSYTDIMYAKMKDRSIFCEENEKIGIGDEVIAIGTPIELTLQNTTTFGRVNATGRVAGVASTGASSVERTRIYEHLIQHQATINPGNSGGPLIDSKGNVVGINSCSFVKDDDGQYVAGIDYAVPIYPVIALIDDIVSDYENSSTYHEPWLNIYGYDINLKGYLSTSKQALYDFPESGVRVYAVNSGVSKNKLETRDVITKITYDETDYQIECLYDLYYHCFRAGKGKTVKVEVDRATLLIHSTQTFDIAL